MPDDQETNEVQITPEMIEAGFQVLRGSGIADEYLEADSLMTADIYRAMRKACLPGQRQKLHYSTAQSHG